MLDVHRGFLRFCCDVAARGDDYERVCFRVQVLEIEPFEEDGRGGDDPLTEGEFLAESGDGW